MPKRTTSPRAGRVVVTLVAILAFGLVAPSAAAITGQLRTVYVLATWDSAPFTHAEVERVAAETDAFFRSSSAGRFSMPGAVVGPVQLPRQAFNACDATVLRDQAPASLFAGFERAVVITPIVELCQFFGEANPIEVLLNGRLFMALAAHELGHTLGLGHASRWDCSGSACAVDEYGSAFSVMGGGNGDFNAYEKSKLGWLTRVVRPRRNATHAIGPIEGPTTLPQALVVTTAASEFWFESRGIPTPSFMDSSVQPAGVAVITGQAPGDEVSPFPRDNLLLPNPRGGARFAYRPGESFVRPGVFRVTVRQHARESAALRFEWLDRVAPARAKLRVRPLSGRRMRLTWEPARDRHSGLDSYRVLVDGRVTRSVSREFHLVNDGVTLRLSRGRHRVGVIAVDRAGNRRRASVRVRVT
jgi:Gametolysin peptidase M11